MGCVVCVIVVGDSIVTDEPRIKRGICHVVVVVRVVIVNYF